MQATSFVTKLSALLALTSAHLCLARPQMAPAPAPAPAAAAAPASGAAGGMQAAQFGQNVTIPGGMTRLIAQYPGGTTVNIMSPEQRTFSATPNPAPLPGNFVSQSSGGPFVALSKQSMVMATLDTAVDMIVRVDMTFDGALATSMGIEPNNVFLPKLGGGGRGAGSWVVDETVQSVDPINNKVSMVMMNSIDGEYTVLGRRTQITKNDLQTYGNDAVQITGQQNGVFGDQEVVYEDGLRISAQSVSPFTVKAEIIPAVQPMQMPAQAKILNNFAWKITASTPEQPINNGQIEFPFNPNQAFNVMPSLNPSTNFTQNLSIARRRTNSTTTGTQFVPIGAQFQQVTSTTTNNAISVQGFGDMTGEYIVLMSEQPLQAEGIIVT